MTSNELRKRIAGFAVQVARFSRPLMADPPAKNAATQLARAGASTAANYRAATQARSHAEFTAKIGVALEEGDETVLWIEHIRAADLAGGSPLDDLLQEGMEIAAILGASKQTSTRNAKARRALPRGTPPRKPRSRK